MYHSIMISNDKTVLKNLEKRIEILERKLGLKENFESNSDSNNDKDIETDVMALLEGDSAINMIKLVQTSKYESSDLQYIKDENSTSHSLKFKLKINK